MIKKIKFLLFFVNLLIAFPVLLQGNLLSYLTIPKELKENSNLVIRSSDLSIDIKEIDQMVVREKKIITVLNNLEIDF